MRLESDNSANTAMDAVFQMLRKRSSPQEGLDFASILSCVLRTIFVGGWDLSTPPLAVADRDMMMAEAKRVRANHNLTRDNAIEATAWAVRRATKARDLDRVLGRLPEGAEDFWHVDAGDPAELQQRVI